MRRTQSEAERMREALMEIRDQALTIAAEECFPIGERRAWKAIAKICEKALRLR